MSAKSMAALWLAVADSKCLRYTAKAEDLRLLLAELALLRAEHEAMAESLACRDEFGRAILVTNSKHLETRAAVEEWRKAHE